MTAQENKNLIQCPVHGWVKPDRNHIVPGSRGGKNKGNVNKKTCPTCHEYYHWLFSNLIPSENIIYQVDRFWGGQIRWLFYAILLYLRRWLLKKIGRDSGWPENEANWTTHTTEAKLRQILEGERRLRDQYRQLGLNTGDYAVVNEKTKEVVSAVQRGAGQDRGDFEKLLGRKLEWYESIRPVVINLSLPGQ